MADDSGRLMLMWGPLVLLGVLVLVFRLAEFDRPDPGSVAGGTAPASTASPRTEPTPVADPRRAEDHALPPATSHPGFDYPGTPRAAALASCAVAPACPPWVVHRSTPRFPQPGDHAGRYWGTGAAEWGPPIGEYGPNAEVDPYWWVPPEGSGQ